MRLFQILMPYAWEQKTADQLSVAISARGKLKQIGLTDAFESVSAYGADEAEKNLIFTDLLKVYGLRTTRFMDDLQAALRSGDGRKVRLHATIGTALLGWSELTRAALASMIQQLTIAPTAAEITAELEAIGFGWNGSAWVAVDIP